LKSIKPTWVQRAISSVSYLSEGRFLITVAIPGAIGCQGYVIDSEGERLFEMGEVLRYGPEVAPSIAIVQEKFFLRGDGYIYLVPSYPYEIWKFDLQGHLVMKMLKEDPLIKPPEITVKGGGYHVRIQWPTFVGPCFTTPEGLLINNFCSWEGEPEEWIYRLDFFDQEGKFLRSYSCPIQSRLFYVDHQSKLYFEVYEEYPKIVRYSFHFGQK